MRRRYQGGGSNLPPHIDIDEIGKFLYEDNYNPYKKRNPNSARAINARKASEQMQRLAQILKQQRKRGQALRYLRYMGGMSRLGYPGLMAAAGMGVLMNTTDPLTPQQGRIGRDHYMGVGTSKFRRGGTSCRTPYRLKRRR
tara:strand:+ start:162 stop:584 length:423 start_codon:yes stop_codon:yes gene_type:complete